MRTPEQPDSAFSPSWGISPAPSRTPPPPTSFPYVSQSGHGRLQQLVSPRIQSPDPKGTPTSSTVRITQTPLVGEANTFPRPSPRVQGNPRSFAEFI